MAREAKNSVTRRSVTRGNPPTVNESLRPLIEGHFLARLVIDLVAVILLVRVIYYPRYRRTDLFLTYFAFNLAIFLIAFLLNRIEMTLGAAFGLFAVFSMLRYRAEFITANDMTYLFLVIALGLLTGVAGGGVPILLFTAALLLGGTAIFESSWLGARERVQDMWYDKVELTHPGRRVELIEDLRTRTGLPVHRVEVRQMDLVRNSARLTVYYDSQ
jgi:hypothetical protein